MAILPMTIGGGGGTPITLTTYQGKYSHTSGTNTYKNITTNAWVPELNHGSNGRIYFDAKQKITLTAYADVSDQFRIELWNSSDVKVTDLLDGYVPLVSNPFTVDVNIESGYYIRLYRKANTYNPSVTFMIQNYLSGLKE